MPRRKAPHGGYREGAGFKPADPADPKTDPPITLRLGEALRARFEAARGDTERADWIRQAIGEKIERDACDHTWQPAPSGLPYRWTCSVCGATKG